MIEIRNRKFQPLALHLANSKRSVHVPPRGVVTVEASDVSAEIRRAAERGFLTLREVKPAPAPKPSRKPETTTPRPKKERE